MARPEQIKPYTEMYPATIKDVHDPERAGRVKINCPAIHGPKGVSDWCPVSLPPNFYTALYETYPVWVSFREGSPDHPIVHGMRLLHNGKFTSPLFRAFTEGPYKDQLNDAKEHAADSWDDKDHKLIPGHGHPPYYDPYLHLFHFKQGARWGVNEEAGEQGTFWEDRVGQGFVTLGDPANPKDPHKETRGAEQFKVEELDKGSTVRKEEGWRSMMKFYATHGQFLHFRVKDKDGDEEIELMNTNYREDNYGNLLLSNLLKRNSLIRIAPGKELGFEQVLDPKNPQKANQRIYDWSGQEFYMESAPGKQKIHIRVPGGEITTWDNIKGSIKSKDRYGNTHEMSSSGIKLNAYTEYSLNANTNIKQTANINVDIKANVNATMKANVNATVRGEAIGNFEGGAIANVKAPLVRLGMAAGPGVAYMGCIAMGMMGPATIIMASVTVSTTP